MITVKATLTKTRNPTEYGFRLEKKIGTIVHELDDGYSLIRFKDLLVKKMVTVNHKKIYKLVNLEWYVHVNDYRHPTVS